MSQCNTQFIEIDFPVRQRRSARWRNWNEPI